MSESDRMHSQQESYLRSLFVDAADGNAEAFRELSSIAFGRNDVPLSRELVKEIESRNITFSTDKEETIESNITYALKHPINYLCIKVRQIEVSIEHAQPPVGSNFEDFPNLPAVTAARLMGLTDEIRLQDWPKSIRDEMSEGKIIRPDGRHPENPNI